jgi:hypothetical protein
LSVAFDRKAEAMGIGARDGLLEQACDQRLVEIGSEARAIEGKVSLNDPRFARSARAERELEDAVISRDAGDRPMQEHGAALAELGLQAAISSTSLRR